MSLLSEDEISDRLKDLPGWEMDGSRIRCRYSLDDFVEAVEFTERIVAPAEEANHHPDLEVSWGAVVVNLTTHDEDGVTEKDFSLAQTIEQIYQEEFKNE